MKTKVLEYNTVFQKEQEGGYSVWVPSLPGCSSQGATFEEATQNIKEAIQLYVEDSSDIQSDSKEQIFVPISVNIS